MKTVEATSMIALDKIRLDGGTQSRAELSQDTIDDYAQAMLDGVNFPDVIIFHDGKNHWLADGFQRTAAAKLAGRKEINASVKQGTIEDAVWYSAGANAIHGLRRSNADKRRAVEMLLRHEKWGKKPSREIARQCGVSDPFVLSIRGAASANGLQMAPVEVTRGGKTFPMKTGNINAGRSPVRVDPSTSQDIPDDEPDDPEYAAVLKESHGDDEQPAATPTSRRTSLFPPPRAINGNGNGHGTAVAEKPAPPAAPDDDDEIDPDTGKPYPPVPPGSAHEEAIRDPELRATKHIIRIGAAINAIRDDGILRDLKKTDRPSQKRTVQMLRTTIENLQAIIKEIGHGKGKNQNGHRRNHGTARRSA